MQGSEYVMAFDPRGVVEVEIRPLSRRVHELAGLRLGVLDNTKWNGNRLLRKTVARLEQQAAARRGQLLPQGKFFEGCRPGLDRDDCRE